MAFSVLYYVLGTQSTGQMSGISTTVDALYSR